MSDNVILRLVFKPEAAADFLLEEQVANGQLVVERDDYTLDEAFEFVTEFYTSLDDAHILVTDAKGKQKVVTMVDFLEAI